jgi:type II restriction/modification system DNA methylase subunit YeeA
MTPQEFIKKWHNCQLAERAFCQEHFNDLCALVKHPSPAAHDTIGNTFCFEKGAQKTGGGNGWADVWKRGHFALEYKGPKGDLSKALEQVQRYALALENPPLLVVARSDLIEIHTNFTNTVSDTHTIALEHIGSPENLEKLRAMFFKPEQLRPHRTTRALTEQAAKLFASLADTLRAREHVPQEVAHFLDKLLFCFFAQNARLLPEGLVTRILENGAKDTDRIDRQLKQLFSSMCKGGDFGADVIDWFNGGLFDSDSTLPLQSDDIAALITVARLDWTEVEPSIFGTLFERGLDPTKRSQLGAHYTDPESIMRIITPVIIEPLNNEWERAKSKIGKGVTDYRAGGKGSKKGIDSANAAYQSFMQKLTDFRVLDPACGSGNFLYLALHALKDIEHKAVLEAEALGLPMGFAGFHTGPHNVIGIEINAYAAELARVTIWIGELQWMLRHGMGPSKNPILKPLNHISCRDAILNNDGSESIWPKADCIVGNPPFLGGQKIRSELGKEYTTSLRARYEGRVPAGADLVTYWFEKARSQIEQGNCEYAGLVATNSIRGGANQKILNRIVNCTKIFNAWSDEEWVNEGAAVRVSLICFGDIERSTLDGSYVEEIHADLTAGEGMNLTKATRLKCNLGISFQGPVLVGPFDVEGAKAREWLKQPNPHGKPNSDVLRPLVNGRDLSSNTRGMWVVDFATMPEAEASLYELPFKHVKQHVKPQRDKNREQSRREKWWLHGRTGADWRAAIAGLPRYIATIRVAKHRTFVWLPTVCWPSDAVVGIARSDEITFGILHSRFHELWSLGLCTWLGIGNDPRYTPTTTFETFPFPLGLTPDLCPADYNNPATNAIADAAKRLNILRDNWLNPPEWINWERTKEEEMADYPLRPVAKYMHDDDVKLRTLTSLYNAFPSWLDQAHAKLDAAVAEAYGWTDYAATMPDSEILRRLLDLNQERAAS